MRLIDADKINYMWQQYKDGEWTDGVTLQSVIRRMPTINPYKWIPCSERLPDCEWGSEVGTFLFQLKSTETMYTGYYGTGGIYRDRYFRTYSNATEGFDVSDVVAWMPLPEPYFED